MIKTRRGPLLFVVSSLMEETTREADVVLVNSTCNVRPVGTRIVVEPRQ